VVLAKYDSNKYCAIRIMKKEAIIENNRMQGLQREIWIMYSIRDAHPFILNVMGILETQVSIRPKILHKFI